MRVLPRGRVPLSQDDGIERGPNVAITVDGQAHTAYAEETIAAAMIAEDGFATRRTTNGAWRGLYCGMGVCSDCLVVVDDVPNTRAGITLVADGMRIARQQGAGLSPRLPAGRPRWLRPPHGDRVFQVR